ncbi:hypothetical protein V5F69_15055, partial [Xanthobacter sp. V2C-4]|uniref:hypothetical protein n=1 Tax=Xanthobacter albus TaxID=3119929 RepID=UPI003726E4A5
MVNRVLIGSYGGVPRLRVARPGYDAMAALSDERLCFDSAWSEILTVYRASWADTSLPGGSDAVAFGGYTWSLRYSTLSYGEVLPVKPIV